MKERYRLGDKLPGCLLTENEWQDLNRLFDSKDKPLNKEDRKEILKCFDELALSHCVGENENNCLLCSEEQHHHTGLCPKCLRSARNGVLRSCGNVRGQMKHESLVCLVCGKEGARAKGLCRSCYYLYKKYGYKSIEEIRQSKQYLRRAR